MITITDSFFKKGITVCLFLENPKRYIVVILMKKKLQIIKLFGRLLNISFLSNKIVSREKLTLMEEDEIVENDINTAQILNTFFSNFVSNLKIAEYCMLTATIL